MKSGQILPSFYFSDLSLGFLEIEMSGIQKMSTPEINRYSLDYLHSRKTCSFLVSLCLTIFQVVETRNLDIFDISLFLTFCVQSIVTLVRSTSKMFLKFIYLHLHWSHQNLSPIISYLDCKWEDFNLILHFHLPLPSTSHYSHICPSNPKKNMKIIILLPSLA